MLPFGGSLDQNGGVTRSTVTASSEPARHPARPARFGIRRNLMRPEDGPSTDRVTYVELFFDLIFVFALTQLSRYLYENQSWTGALESAMLVLALWWVWVYTTWVTNWLDPAKLPVRAAVLTLSLVGLVVSVSIYESFGDRGIVFAIAYSVLQLGRTGFMVLAVARHDPELRRTFVRVLIWLSLSSVFWIVGALLPLQYRLPLWLIALAIEYLSAGFGFRVPRLGASGIDDWNLSGAHIAERSALFVLIALGESLLVTGFAFVAQESSTEGVVGMLLAFTSCVAMWWLYFDHSERAGSKAIEAAKDPGRIARLAYTYVHALIIAGIVLTSVADKEVLTHPLSAMTLSTAVVLVGGPFLYLLGMLLFRLVIAREVLLSYLVGLVALLAAFAGSFGLNPLQLGSITTVVLVIVAGWETVVRVRRGTDDEKAG